MRIPDIRQTCNDLALRSRIALLGLPRDLLVIGVLIAVSFASFTLGFLAGRDLGQGSGSPVVTP